MRKSIPILISFLAGISVAYLFLKQDIDKNSLENKSNLVALDKMTVNINNMINSKITSTTLLNNLNLNYRVLLQYVNNEKLGKPLDIAIRDTSEKLRESIETVNQAIENIEDAKVVENARSEIQKSIKLLAEAEFYSSK